MESYLYSYLIGNVTLIVVWFILFFWRKDTRKMMLTISALFGIAGLIVDPIYSSDWWFPKTLTGTMPGIESFLFGFTVAGITSVAYTELFSKKLRNRKSKKKKKDKKDINLLVIALLTTVLFFGSYFILGWNSFYSSFPALLIPTAFIYFKRKDLILESLTSALLLTIISFIFYRIPELITPGWINSAWNFNMISGVTLFMVPVEDLIWFFMAGLLIGPLYEYWQDKKLVDKR